MLQGTKITKIMTINSMYADNNVCVFDDEGNEYKMPTSTILQMVNEYQFKIEQKRKYKHLIEACLLE